MHYSTLDSADRCRQRCRENTTSEELDKSNVYTKIKSEIKGKCEEIMDLAH